MAASDDYVFAQSPEPLVITVNGLFEKNIDQELLQYLRVQQSGQFNGQGSFNIYVNNPNLDSTNDIQTILLGYKFQIRVWDSNKQIKHDWTDQISTINDLSNGDKVEWKLVSPNNQPVSEAYYNTIANGQSANGYSFMQVNYIGNDSYSIVSEGIGQVPADETAYPENSGFAINNLIDESQEFPGITQSEFERLIDEMAFSYEGINGLGNMVSSKNISTVEMNVINSSTTRASQQTYTFAYLIENGIVNFYQNDTIGSGIGQFDWTQEKNANGDWITSPGCLSNGDSITVTYNDGYNNYVVQLPNVSGLSTQSDSMNPLWWVLIALASTATLGIFYGIYALAKNRKLKIKK